MEKIFSIQKVEGVNGNSRWSNWDGYEIQTDAQKIQLLIQSHQDCCESWGYFISEDDVQKFIGAELIELTLTDTALNTVKLKENDLKEEQPYVYEGGVMFVNINTTNGLLQFCAYNEHNGYYGHEAKVISTQLTHEEWL